jgi:hypothetical protein
MSRPHGYARYRLDGCRCYTCGFARSEYDQRRDRLIAYGRWQPFTPISQTQAHIAELAALGYGHRRIAQLAALNRKIVRDIAHGFRHDPGRGNPPLTKIRTETATAILAVPLDAASVAAGQVVCAGATWERIHALIALGYTRAWIAQQIGGQRPALQLDRRRVTAANERAVAELYERIGDTPGPSERARTEGRRRGWLTPFQLEAARFGPVAETGTLDEIAVERLMAGTLTIASHARSPDLTEAVRRLARMGLTDRQIGERVHRTTDAVLKIRRRNGVTTTRLDGAA